MISHRVFFTISYVLIVSSPIMPSRRLGRGNRLNKWLWVGHAVDRLVNVGHPLRELRPGISALRPQALGFHMVFSRGADSVPGEQHGARGPVWLGSHG